MITAFACFYNEAALIPYFLSHYHFADAIEAFVSPSIDATRELLAADPRVTIHDVVMPDGMDDDIKIGWINTAIASYPRGAGWHLVLDADELIWPTGDPSGETAHGVLARVPGQVSVLKAHMVNVFRAITDTDLDPTQRPVVLQRRHGCPGAGGMNSGYQKPCLSRAGRGIRYTVGHHFTRPRTLGVPGHDWVGAHWQNADPSFAITRRVRDRRDRMSRNNLAKGYGRQHYTHSVDEVTRELESHAHDPVVF